MRKYSGIIVGAVAGIIMGLVGGPVWIILPWGAIAVGLGYDSKSYKLLSSAVFGFIASFIFMMQGYSGTESRMSRVLPFVLIALFGGLAGLLCGWVGKGLSQRKQ